MWGSHRRQLEPGDTIGFSFGFITRCLRGPATESHHCFATLFSHATWPLGVSTPVKEFYNTFAVGKEKPESCSTCLRKTEGFISNELQMSKMLRSDGLVLPNSIRLIKARS